MPNNITVDELNRRKKVLQDAYDFSAYIPDDLRMKLEEELGCEARELVVQLQILAIQYGRALERKEFMNQVDAAVKQDRHRNIKPSSLITSMVGNVTRDIKREDILIVPGHALPTKEH